jgi:hypothetical protein
MNNAMSKSAPRRLMLVCAAVMASATVYAADAPIELEGTTIRGATELPKVLYIVPWKKADLGDVSIQPGDDIFNEELVPLDRDIFRRQVMFYDQLQKDSAAGTPGKKK